MLRAVYTIREVYVDPHYDELFFHLREFLNPVRDFALGWMENGYVHERFRPVRDTSIESLRGLLSPTPDDVRRYADELECL